MKTTDNKFRNKRWLIFLLVFLFCNLFLASYYPDTWNSPNSVSRILPVLTWQEDGTLKITKYHQSTGDKSKVGEHYYSDKAPLPTLLMIPVNTFIHRIGLEKKGEAFLYDHHPVHIWHSVKINDGRSFQMDKLYYPLLIAGLLFGALPFALMVWLSLLYTGNRQPDGYTVLLVMLGWYGSFLFVFSGTFFSHIFTGFLLLVSYLLLHDRKKYLPAGLFAGLAFLSEYPAGIVIALWPVLIFLKEKKPWKPVLFLLGVLPSVLFILYYNYQVTGNPFHMLNAYHAFAEFGNKLKQNYGFGFGNISWESIWGLSFSAYMGIFFHIPMLLLVLFYLGKDIITHKLKVTRLLTSYAGLFAVVYFVLMSMFFTWWGGWSYGPRYLIPLGCVLVFEGIRYLRAKKVPLVAYLIFTVFGLICAWLAKSTLMYMIPDMSDQTGPKPASGSNPVSGWLIPEFTAGRINGNSLLTVFVSPQVSTFLWLLLFILISSWLIIYASKIYGFSGYYAVKTSQKNKNSKKKHNK